MFVFTDYHVHTECSSCRMHDIFNSRFLEKSLDSGNFLRDGCSGSSSIKKRKKKSVSFSFHFLIKDGVGYHSQWNETKVFFSQYQFKNIS